VFTARYALSPYIKQIRFVFKGLIHSFVNPSTAFIHSFTHSLTHSLSPFLCSKDSVNAPSYWHMHMRSCYKRLDTFHPPPHFSSSGYGRPYLQALIFPRLEEGFFCLLHTNKFTLTSSKEYYTPALVTKRTGFASGNYIVVAGSAPSVHGLHSALDDLGIGVRFLTEAETFLFSTASKPAPGSNKLFVKWMLAALSSRVKRPGRKTDPGPWAGAETQVGDIHPLEVFKRSKTNMLISPTKNVTTPYRIHMLRLLNLD
jgi:hypothetical protein